MSVKLGQPPRRPPTRCPHCLGKPSNLSNHVRYDCKALAGRNRPVAS